MAEKYADLRIRAHDEFTKVLNSGQKALEDFQKSASRKDMLLASIAQRRAIADQSAAISDLQKQYAALAVASKSDYTRDMAVQMVNLRDKIYKARDALEAQNATLEKMKGGRATSSFLAFSQGVTEMQKRAEIAANSIEGLRAKVVSLQAAQDAAAAGAKRYLANQGVADKVGPSFGSTNAALGGKFAEEAKKLKREIASLEQQMARMKGATQGSFLEFSKRATDLEKTAAASKEASDGLGKLSEAENKLAAASKATENSRQRAARMAGELRAAQSEIIAKFGAESAEAQKLTAALAALDAKAAGVTASQGRMGQAITGASGAMAGQGRRAKQNWGSDVVGEDQEVMAFGLRPYQLTNLGYQVNDVVSGMAMGQPIMQIFAQQLGQIVQTFPAAARGMMGFFQLLERAPARTGAVGAALALVGTAIYRVAKESADAREALSGADKLMKAFGDSASYSVDRIARATFAMREVAGSIETALDLAKTFTRAGIRTDRFEELADVASKLSGMTGGKLPETAEQLATAFSGGFDSLREFDKELNIFTASELEAIRAMYETGDAAGAQEMAFDALQAKLKSTSDTAAGPWSRAFRALGGVWDSLIERLANSFVIQGLAEAFDILAESITGAADAAKWLLDTDVFKVATGDFSPIFGDQEKSVESLTAKIARMKEVVAELEERQKNSGGVWNWLLNTSDRLDALREELRQTEFELDKLQGKADPGLTVDMVDSLRKSYGDFSAELAKTNKARQDEAATAGLSARAAEVLTSKREALNKALADGLTKLPEWAALWAKEEAAIEASVNAKHDAIDAAERLKEAQDLVAGAIEDSRSEQEAFAEQIKELEDALREMAAAGEAGSEKFKQGQEALAKLKKEAAEAETPFDKLGKKIPEVARELQRLNELSQINVLEQEALKAAKSWGEVAAAIKRAGEARAQVNKDFDEQAINDGLSGSLVDRIIGVESGGNPLAKNPNSSATGLGQFIESTWLGLFKKHFPDRAAGMTNAMILALRKDSDTSKQMVELYMRENAQALQAAGNQINDANLYLAHFLGSGGANALLSSAPGTQTSAVLSQGQISANASILEGKTREEVIAWAQRKVGVSAQELAVVESINDTETKRLEQQQEYIKNLDLSLSRQEYENSIQKLGATEREVALAIYDEQRDAEEKGLVLGEERKRQIADTIRLKNRERDAQREVSDAEKRVNDIIAERTALEGQLRIAEGNNDPEKAAGLKQKIADLNVELTAAIQKSQELQRTMGGPGADAAIAKMETLKLRTAEYGREAAITADQINNMIGMNAANAVNQFAQSLAEGKGFVESLGDAFRKFAADTLIQIGQLIVQLTIMNALKNSGIGGGMAGMLNGFMGMGVAHTGGMIGSGIASRRVVHPSILTGAVRYHTGGVIGLKPNERPIIAEVGEEMLTEDDPRHRKNLGKSNGITIINAVDGADAIEQGLATPSGQDAVVNHMRSNRAKYRAALGI